MLKDMNKHKIKICNTMKKYIWSASKYSYICNYNIIDKMLRKDYIPDHMSPSYPISK